MACSLRSVFGLFCLLDLSLSAAVSPSAPPSTVKGPSYVPSGGITWETTPSPAPTAVVPSPGIFGLPANFSFPPLNQPPVIGGVPRFDTAFAPPATAPIQKSGNRTAPSGSSSSGVQFRDTHSRVAQAVDVSRRQSDGYWLANINHGNHPLAPAGYPWFRNVMDYGAKGDGVSDDTNAINAAVAAGGRCTPALNGCNSTTVLGALVYFPPGTYLISAPIFLDFYTQAIGSPISPPTIKATSTFQGIAMIDTDFYIPNENGEEWYQNQNNFYRQVRNFVLDLTDLHSNPSGASQLPTGIHWQVAQATSLQNIVFQMTQGGTQQGLFIENGSGGFLSDLTFNFGAIGMRVGSQQFTMRGLTFLNCATGIQTLWNWAWTFQGLNMNAVSIAVDARGNGDNTGPDAQPWASMSILDSSFSALNILVFGPGSDPDSDLVPQVFLDNVAISSVPGSTTVVGTAGGQSIYTVTGDTVINSWARGKTYVNITDNGDGSTFASAGPLSPAPVKPLSLLGPDSRSFFTRSKPLYATPESVVSVALHGAVGDGKTDSTEALNAAFAACASSGSLCFVPMGIYIITDTVLIPTGTRVTGETWSQIMGAGPLFGNASLPVTMVRVGNAGDVGAVEIQDLLFTVRGPAPGAVLLEWNIKANAPGAAAMWDTHFRVGGAAGSNMQSDTCPTLAGVKPDCMGASMMLHVTPGASGYFENIHGWSGDHDLDVPAQTQVSVYTARGCFIETQEPTWLWGTAFEHATLYQYQVLDSQNIFMGMIQTETPYYQPAPAAPAPFQDALFFRGDPAFENCDPSSPTCPLAWALRVVNSTLVFIYGAGLYSFFNNYDQTCILDGSESCQNALVDLSFTQGLFLYDLATIGAKQVVSPEGGIAVLQTNTQFWFTTVVIAYLGLAVAGRDQGGSGDGIPALGDPDTSIPVLHSSPNNAPIMPIPGCTTLASQATLTMTPACETAILHLPDSGANNSPPGPDFCGDVCDLFRLLTDTCCGSGGTLGNPIVIPPGVPLPAEVLLPPGFVSSTPFTDRNGTLWPAGQPLPFAVPVDGGTTFGSPFVIPAGTALPNPVDVPDPDHDTHTVSILPLPCTTLPATATFTMSPQCTSDVAALQRGGEQNTPPGPRNCHEHCSLFRRLSRTCCGLGGFLWNPFFIPHGIHLPWPALFPAGFTFPFDFVVGNVAIAANVPIDLELLVPEGFQFPVDLLIPSLLSLGIDGDQYNSAVASSEGVDDGDDQDGDDDDQPAGIPRPPLTITYIDPTFANIPAAVSTEMMLGLGWLYAQAENYTAGAFTPPGDTTTFSVGPTPPSQTVTTTTTAAQTTSSTSGPPPPPPSPFPLGCYSDSDARALPTQVEASNLMSVDLCLSLCSAQGFGLFGVEFGQECWCGNSIANGHGPIDGSNCNVSCPGNSAETCGGSWALSLYRTDNTVVVPPGWAYVGCYTDADDRTLPTLADQDVAMTVELCASSCGGQRFGFFGVEDGDQCWCGAAISAAGQPVAVPDSQCNVPCGGNAGEDCGAPWRINVYSATSTSFAPAGSAPTPSGGTFHLVEFDYVDDGQPVQALFSLPSDRDDCADAAANIGKLQTFALVGGSVVTPPSKILETPAFSLGPNICDGQSGDLTFSAQPDGSFSFTQLSTGQKGRCVSNYNGPGEACATGQQLIQLLVCQADSDVNFCQNF